ncbi:hypothetical protein [Pseudomonas sichuanensis]|uniref:DUF3077 domain-containing protein n=1 Tax=Pseudomonas sichuanensis TaxID=2213015 RepID=A0ABV0DG59_9PSED
MKKIVPDPPPKIPVTPFFTVHADMYPPDALAHVNELLRGVSETIDEYCRNHPGELGLHMLANAAHAADIARALSDHAMGSFEALKLKGQIP